MSDIDNAGDDSWHLTQLGVLERRFKEALPAAPRGRDDFWMRRYHQWLEVHGIKASNDRGWPTPAVYDETNVGGFIESVVTTPVAAPPKMTAAHVKAITNALSGYALHGGKDGPFATEERLMREILSHVSSEVQQEGVWVPRKEITGWLGDLLAVNPATIGDANQLEALHSNMRYWLGASR